MSEREKSSRANDDVIGFLLPALVGNASAESRSLRYSITHRSRKTPDA